ncbi:hypothetical protein CRYUN_Cryun04dG0188800 [Craigia yunnanensis]
MVIQKFLVDPYGVLDNWDGTAVDPCSWNMVTCSTDGLVIVLGSPSWNLCGTLAPTIGNLTNLQLALLQNNNISGRIPSELGKISKLQTLDLSNNYFSGQIPGTLSRLKSIQYLRLNNNSLSGTIPSSLANMTQLTFLDLSFNNLNGPVPGLLAKTFNIVGNSLICAKGTEQDCSRTRPMPMSFSLNISQNSQGRPKSDKFALAFGSSLGCICLQVFAFFLLLKWRRRKQQILFKTNAKTEEEESIGNLNRFQFQELVIATNNFSSKSIVGRGGFGNVYKGHLKDGTVVAVKRLTDGNASAGGEIQFQTELKMIGLAVHRNLLQLYGFCMTATERLLVYPFMSNGSVASRLKATPALDWGTRKKIALGTARGLIYLHEQCDPKIIHRDVKAANVLLDDKYEPVVGDFGLVKLMEHQDSHVTTAVRGTIGYIAPEYLSTGQSSDRTDVFAFGVLLFELMTGKRPSEFGEMAIEEKGMIDWVNKIYKEKRFDELIEKGLENIYDQFELERLIQLSLSCIQYDPNDRPKMSEVLQILEEIAEREKDSQEVEEVTCRAEEFSSSGQSSEIRYHVEVNLP